MPLYDKLPSLLEDHWEESAKNKRLMVLKPNREAYQKLEDGGNLVSLFAFVDDVIVGYSVNIVVPHIHYVDLITAHNDVIFVSKEYRNSVLGLRLIKATEEECAKAGARLLLLHAKEDTPLSKILPRKGYGVQDIIYSKELRD